MISEGGNQKRPLATLSVRPRSDFAETLARTGRIFSVWPFLFYEVKCKRPGGGKMATLGGARLQFTPPPGRDVVGENNERQ